MVFVIVGSYFSLVSHILGTPGKSLKIVAEMLLISITISSSFHQWSMLNWWMKRGVNISSQLNHRGARSLRPSTKDSI